MANNPPRVAAIHDLSGFGRCSLSVILPVLSVMGIQCCCLPTAVLSTHTGGFGEVIRQDLTNYIELCLIHYRALRLEMDCIYTGYLGSPQQSQYCLNFFQAYPKAFKVVDPVMGDNGKLYHSFTSEMVAGIASLVAKARVITPNLTEAMVLLGEDPVLCPLSTRQARSLLARLSALGPDQVVITGVTLATGEYGNVCYDRRQNTYWKSITTYLPVSYPGTGDIFAAVLTAGLLQGNSLAEAMNRATCYIEITIKTTYDYGADFREGVLLEKTLPWLTQEKLSKDYIKL